MASSDRKSKGLDLSLSVIYISVGVGLSSILLVGLLCGLVARPNNCIRPQIPSDLISTTKPTQITTGI